MLFPALIRIEKAGEIKSFLFCFPTPQPQPPNIYLAATPEEAVVISPRREKKSTGNIITNPKRVINLLGV